MTSIIPSKQQIYLMYPGVPKRELRERIISIMTNDRKDLRRLKKHTLYPKDWELLKEEIGNPTHDCHGLPIVNDQIKN